MIIIIIKYIILSIQYGQHIGCVETQHFVPEERVCAYHYFLWNLQIM